MMITRRILNLLPYALIVHLLMAIWFFGTPEIFPECPESDCTLESKVIQQAGSDQTIYFPQEKTYWERMSLDQGIPSLVLAILSSIFFVVMFILRQVRCKSRGGVREHINEH